MGSESGNSFVKVLEAPKNVADAIRRSVRMLNRISGQEIFVPLSFISLDRRVVEQWASDLLSLKNVICALPERLGISSLEYAELAGIDGADREYLRRSPYDWRSGFFRPDCVLTRDGLKVLEFNIDTGSMSFSAGLWQRKHYENVKEFTSWLRREHRLRLKDLFFSPDLFLKYLRKKSIGGKKLYCWDLSGRSADICKRRAGELAFFRGNGADIELVQGREILKIARNDSYCFRYFAYPHFFNKGLDIYDIYTALPADFISKNDVAISSAIYDNKVNMALLWSPIIQRHLLPDEAALVARYVPRTYQLGDVRDWKEFLGSRNKLVLKYGIGLQGNGVHIGRQHGERAWGKILAAAAERSDAVVQEFCGGLPISLKFTNGRKTVSARGAHIINMYYVDNSFGGVTLRIARHRQNTKIGAMDMHRTLGEIPLVISAGD